jgi:hypothetical protein
MKKSIFALAIPMLMAGAMFTGCQSSKTKVENAQDKVAVANQELNQAVKDSIQQFRTESAERISNNEKNIAEFRARIASQKKVNKAKYEKKLAELEKRNSDMKMRLADYKDEEQVKWEKFKVQYNQDMDALGKAFKDLMTDKAK